MFLNVIKFAKIWKTKLIYALSNLIVLKFLIDVSRRNKVNSFSSGSFRISFVENVIVSINLTFKTLKSGSSSS